jgi:hypothetical protein
MVRTYGRRINENDIIELQKLTHRLAHDCDDRPTNKKQWEKLAEEHKDSIFWRNG